MDNNNIAHGDEKWFYLMRDRTVCRIFPRFARNEWGEVERTVNMPADPRVYYKSRMPKVTFLAVTAKPRDEYNFDGRSEFGLLPWCEKQSTATQGRELSQGKLTSSRPSLSLRRSTGKLCCRRTEFLKDA